MTDGWKIKHSTKKVIDPGHAWASSINVNAFILEGFLNTRPVLQQNYSVCICQVRKALQLPFEVLNPSFPWPYSPLNLELVVSSEISPPSRTKYLDSLEVLRLIRGTPKHPITSRILDSMVGSIALAAIHWQNSVLKMYAYSVRWSS